MLLLDTHAWVWIVEGDTGRVGPKARRLADRTAARGEICISAASVFEVTALHTAGRLRLSHPVSTWIREALQSTGGRLTDHRHCRRCRGNRVRARGPARRARGHRPAADATFSQATARFWPTPSPRARARAARHPTSGRSCPVILHCRPTRIAGGPSKLALDD
jgi:PIN domain nuclease of toxin-antitoxin system